MTSEHLKIPISKKLIDKLLRTDTTAVVPILQCPICGFGIDSISIYSQDGKMECPKCGERVRFIPVTARGGEE